MVETTITVFNSDQRIPTIYLRVREERKSIKLQIPVEGSEEYTYINWEVTDEDLDELTEALENFQRL